MRLALSMMRRSVRKRAGFSIDDVSPLDVVSGSFIPALFGKPLPCHLLHLLLKAFLPVSSSYAWRSTWHAVPCASAGFSIDSMLPLDTVPGSFIHALFGEPLLRRFNPSQSLCLLGLREPVSQPSLLGALTQGCLLTLGATDTLRTCCQE